MNPYHERELFLRKVWQTETTSHISEGLASPADEVKPFRCKHLIAVLENPTDVKNIGTVIRNENALGVEKVYVVDPRRSLPDDRQDLRDRRPISKTSVSAVKMDIREALQQHRRVLRPSRKKRVQVDSYVAACERQGQHFPSRR
jgi:tRNA G18 (ribose-2'-O)-methylase SpoU